MAYRIDTQNPLWPLWKHLFLFDVQFFVSTIQHVFSLLLQTIFYQLFEEFPIPPIFFSDLI